MRNPVDPNFILFIFYLMCILQYSAKQTTTTNVLLFYTGFLFTALQIIVKHAEMMMLYHVFFKIRPKLAVKASY